MVRRIKNLFWTTSEDLNGCFWKSPRNNTNTLCLFIHGLMDDRFGWRDTPELIFNKIRALDDIEKHDGDDELSWPDIVAFEYPSMPYQSGGLDEATVRLRDALNDRWANYSHLLFICHSFGGLVVKNLLVGDKKNGGNIWPRTRLILNLAVPHTGGHWYLTWPVACIYPILGVPCLIVGPLLDLMNRRLKWFRYKIGYSRIPGELWARSFKLRRLESAFFLIWAESDFRLVCRDLISLEDEAAASPDVSFTSRAVATRRELTRVPGFHGIYGVDKSALEGRTLEQTVIGLLAQEVQSLVVALHQNSNQLKTLAKQTLDFLETRTKEGKVVALYGGSYDKRDMSVRNAEPGTQESTFQSILATALDPRDVQGPILVTGHAGVGKSSVVRALCKQLCEKVLRENVSNVFPVSFPMHQFDLTPEELAQFIRDDPLEVPTPLSIIFRHWCRWVNDILAGENGVGTRVSPVWLDRLLIREHSLILFDGVDEFLVRHNSLRLTHFQRMLDQILAVYKKASVMICVRSGHPNLRELVGSSARTFEILRLSEEVADTRYPGVRQFINENASNRDVLRDILLTPLYLEQLGPRIMEINATQPLRGELQNRLRTRANAIYEALRCLIKSNPLDLCETESIDLLSLIACAFHEYRQHRESGEMSEYDVKTYVLEACKEWRSQRAPTVFTTRAVEHVFSLLTQTVFVPTGGGRFRFVHREWSEFLLGWHLYNCFYYWRLDLWGKLAFKSVSIYSAGELLGEIEVTPDQVKEVIKATHEQNNRLVLGTFFSLVSTSRSARFDWNAIEPLLPALEIDPVLRSTLLCGLGHRALFDQVENLGDATARQIRANLPALFQRYLDDSETRWKKDPVAKSLAWCYSKALGLPPVNKRQEALPWSRLPTERPDCDLILESISGLDGEVNPERRSLQVSLVGLVRESLRFPATRPISAVHYLYYVSLAFAHGRYSQEAVDYMGEIFDSRSRFAQVMSEFEIVPEVEIIYLLCKDLFENPRSAFVAEQPKKSAAFFSWFYR